jgi:hypothetical protein
VTTRFVGITGSGSGDGSTWGNAPAAFPSGLSTVLAASTAGDTIKIEAGVHTPITVGMSWTKRVNLKGETRGGADGKAIITGNRTDPWPVNGVWADGKTVGGITYPTLTAANAGPNVFVYQAAAANSGGSVFSFLSFRNTGTPFKPSLGSSATLGTITVQDTYTCNTNGLVYIDANTDGQCAITAARCRSIGYSEGMFRAFGDINLTDCHGDAQSQFHSPTTNLFGFHVQDAIVGVTSGPYNLTVLRCSMINHAAHAPLGSSQDPSTSGHYPQGDGGVAEENTNVISVKFFTTKGNADRGFDLKPPATPGAISHMWSTGNGYSVAAHDDTVDTYITDSFLGTSFRPSYDNDKSSAMQASGNLHALRCVIEQRATPGASQYFVAYGTVQPAHTQSGTTVPQRTGHMFVDSSLIRIKAGLAKTLLSPGGSPVTTPTYSETNTTTITV